MTTTKLSVSLPSALLARADQLLSQPGEGRSALIARVLADAVLAAEEAEIDAAYDRAFANHPPTRADLDRTDAIAQAAIRSTHSSSVRNKQRGTRL